ncbi:MAG: hydroxymethylbilane synthase [Candidatus Micrarchaeia archaeon]
MIRIGSRTSTLAKIQTELFAKVLKEKGEGFRIKRVRTSADKSNKKIQDLGPNAFTKELDQALLTGEIDLAVHSLKDIEINLPKGLEICYIFGRNDARDCILSKNNEKLDELKQGAVIGCSSQRRVAELSHLRPDLITKPIRGNVPTRIEKLKSDFDAVVLAVAGLQRLGLENKISQTFEINEFVPAAGQGALGIVCRKGENFGFAGGKNFDECLLEREFARGLGACRNPVGAFCKKNGEELELTGLRYKGNLRITPNFSGGKTSVVLQIREWKKEFQRRLN